MLNKLIRTLAETRVGLGRIHTFVRAHGGSICLILAKYCSLCGRFVYRLLFLWTRPLISLE